MQFLTFFFTYIMYFNDILHDYTLAFYRILRYEFEITQKRLNKK